MPPLACRAFGHRYRFTTDGPVMTWTCERCHDLGGSKTYPSAAEATRYAAALDKEDRDDLGRRGPWLGLFPLRVLYRLRHRRASGSK